MRSSRFSFSSLESKTALLAIVSLVALLYVLPSIKVLPASVLAKLPFHSTVNLGLDLQGGSYLTFRVEIEKALTQALVSQVDAVREALKKEGLEAAFTVVDTPNSPSKVSVTGSPKSLQRARDVIKEDFRELEVSDESSDKVNVSLTYQYSQELRNSILDQSVRVVRNRVDEFGVSEPSISTKGADKIVVELPGVKDVNQAKDLIGQTAKLEFRLVDEETMRTLQASALPEILDKKFNLKFTENMKLSEYTEKANALLKDQIPEKSEIVFEREKSLIGYVLFKNAPVTGGDLQSAQVTRGQFKEPQVSFTFKSEGAKRFGELTEANIGKRLAIVLDGTVKSAPVINSKITGQGVITVGRGGNRNETYKEASNLSIVLRAGALPASLQLQEQRVVGPSLGEDSIRYGVTAGVVGCALIFMFMISYYRLSGTIATISLLLNLLFSFAILIGIGATLTLPGIAGLALIIGMGVDSNVLIFERMRDEILEGSVPDGAVHQGFKRAFTAIFDANITHGIVGLVLYNFGTGPLKGFAVTLLIGIFTTLFCAVTVCQLMFEHYLKFKPKRLSI